MFMMGSVASKLDSSTISFVGGYEVAVAGTSSSLDIPLNSLTGGTNSSPSQDDFVLVFAATSNSGATVQTGTGWINEGTCGASYDLDSHGRVYSKVMGATPDTSITYPNGTGGSVYACTFYVLVFRGVDTTTPIDVTTTTSSLNYSVLITPPNITPVTNMACVVVCAVGVTQELNKEYSAPSYLSYSMQAYQDDTYDSIGSMGYKLGVKAEFSPTAMAYEGTDSTNYSSGAMTLALRPAI